MKTTSFWVVVFMVVVILIVCLAIQKESCKYSKDGYLQTYQWIDGWSKNCQSEGKVFTIESDENGTIINPRCIVEKEGANTID